MLEFVGGPGGLPAPPELPLTVEQDFTSLARLADVGILLVVLAALLGAGFLLRGALPRLRPAVLAAGAVAILMWTAVNPLFWQLASVTVDAGGLTVHRYTVSHLRIEWDAVREVRVTPGEPLPLAQDDRSLRLLDAGGEHVDVPRFLPRSAEVAAAVLAALGERSPP